MKMNLITSFKINFQEKKRIKEKHRPDPLNFKLNKMI